MIDLADDDEDAEEFEARPSSTTTRSPRSWDLRADLEARQEDQGGAVKLAEASKKHRHLAQLKGSRR
jgi:hypothetical protein